MFDLDDKEDTESYLQKFINFVVVLAITFGTVLWASYVAQLCWEWVVTPTFKIRPLSLRETFLILVTLRLFLGYSGLSGSTILKRMEGDTGKQVDLAIKYGFYSFVANGTILGLVYWLK